MGKTVGKEPDWPAFRAVPGAGSELAGGCAQGQSPLARELRIIKFLLRSPGSPSLLTVLSCLSSAASPSQALVLPTSPLNTQLCFHY